jgi:hypothetical protein
VRDQLYLNEHVSVSGQRRLLAAAIVLATLAGLFYVGLFNPVGGSGLYPSCPLFSLTGLYCPGCGTTRALHQLLHGHFATAFGLNALMVLALPVILYAYLSYALLAIRGRGLPRVFVPPVFIKTLLWTVVAFGILRNLPLYPFSLLAP